jgi:sulfur carrier protein
MRISLNGEETDSRGAKTVAELVHLFGLPAEGVLIEYNGVALYRREWAERALSAGDQLEIIRVVAGG